MSQQNRRATTALQLCSDTSWPGVSTEFGSPLTAYITAEGLELLREQNFPCSDGVLASSTR